MAQQGGCMCGNVRYQVEGDAAATALCHCADCRKISGSTHSTNAVFPEGQFKITQGTPKQHAKTADSGKVITSFFCGDCGSTLYRESDTFKGTKIVKIGTLDSADALTALKPGAEFFAKGRTSWVQPLEGAVQKDGM